MTRPKPTKIAIGLLSIALIAPGFLSADPPPRPKPGTSGKKGAKSSSPNRRAASPRPSGRTRASTSGGSKPRRAHDGRKPSPQKEADRRSLNRAGDRRGRIDLPKVVPASSSSGNKKGRKPFGTLPPPPGHPPPQPPGQSTSRPTGNRSATRSRGSSPQRAKPSGRTREREKKSAKSLERAQRKAAAVHKEVRVDGRPRFAVRGGYVVPQKSALKRQTLDRKQKGRKKPRLLIAESKNQTLTVPNREDLARMAAPKPTIFRRLFGKLWT